MRVIAYAKPITIGGVVADITDLKKSPIRTRIRRMVTGSILLTSSMELASVSWYMAALPVTYVVGLMVSVLVSETRSLRLCTSDEGSYASGKLTETRNTPPTPVEE